MTRQMYGIPPGVTVREFLADLANSPAIAEFRRERRNAQKRARRARKKEERAAEAEIQCILDRLVRPWQDAEREFSPEPEVSPPDGPRAGTKPVVEPEPRRRPSLRDLDRSSTRPEPAPEPAPQPRTYWRRLFTGRAQEVETDTGKVLRTVAPGAADYPHVTQLVNWS